MTYESMMTHDKASFSETITVITYKIIVGRGGSVRALMVKRNTRQSFMPNLWVFPGGTMDEADLKPEWRNTCAWNPGKGKLRDLDIYRSVKTWNS